MARQRLILLKMTNNESKIRKVLFNEVSFFVSITAFVIGCVLFISKPDAEMRQNIALMQQKIEIIESNHLAGMEKAIKEQADEIVEIKLVLERILTILEE